MSRSQEKTGLSRAGTDMVVQQDSETLLLTLSNDVSEDVTLSHLTLRNSPFWTVHPVYVRGFTAHHLFIFNPSDVSNTDGIDPDSTQNVLIHDVYIETGDDGIAVKSGWDEYGYDYGVPSENITIRDSHISSPCAAIAIGSEMSGGVANVTVMDSTQDSTAGVHIKNGPGRGGYVHDVLLENLIMKDCAAAIMIDLEDSKEPPDDPTYKVNLSALPDIRRVRARHINGTGSITVAKLEGLKGAIIHDVELEDMHFDGGQYVCGNVTGTFHDVTPQPCADIRPQ